MSLDDDEKKIAAELANVISELRHLKVAQAEAKRWVKRIEKERDIARGAGNIRNAHHLQRAMELESMLKDARPVLRKLNDMVDACAKGIFKTRVLERVSRNKRSVAALVETKPQSV